MFLFNSKDEPDYKGLSVKEIPEVLDTKTIYVVGDKGHKWVAAFKCPCGCKQIIQLNLLKEGDASWRVTIHRDSSISIRPSVWRITGCKSHFTITRGNINWVSDLSFW